MLMNSGSSLNSQQSGDVLPNRSINIRIPKHSEAVCDRKNLTHNGKEKQEICIYLPHNHGILVGPFAALLREETSIVTGAIRKHAAKNHNQKSIGFPLSAQALPS